MTALLAPHSSFYRSAANSITILSNNSFDDASDLKSIDLSNYAKSHSFACVPGSKYLHILDLSGEGFLPHPSRPRCRVRCW